MSIKVSIKRVSFLFIFQRNLYLEDIEKKLALKVFSCEEDLEI